MNRLNSIRSKPPARSLHHVRRRVSRGVRQCVPFCVLFCALAVPMIISLIPGTALAQTPPAQPEASSGQTARALVSGRHMMAATANPHATRAAFMMLERGGSALDAAIAAQMVLTLTEPQSSGIGGGAFLMHYDARSQVVQAWDGRETAPAAATEKLFEGRDGKPLAFFDAVVGGRSVGTPGVLRMLEAAHAQHGRLPWAMLFEPAIRLSDQGFEVSARLNRLLAIDPHLKHDPTAARYFYDANGAPWPVGHRLKNPELADTLAQIARRGSLALHAGPIARDIVEAVRSHPVNPGLLDQRDLAFYQPKLRTPLCSSFRSRMICGMPAPSSGAIAVAQILGFFDAVGAPRYASADANPQAEGVHVFTQAGRLAFADRNQYVADPDFVKLPTGMIDPDYLKRRASLIGPRDMGRALPGDPPGAPHLRVSEATLEQPGTSHLSIIDARGNAIAMTTTIEDQFGARLMVRGFLLNNQLTDFSFAAQANGMPVANRVEPGKRPRSSMAPTLVFATTQPAPLTAPATSAYRGTRPTGSSAIAARPPADAVIAPGPLLMTLGSPGGSQIIGYVARTLLATIGDGLDVQTAISMPNLGNRNGPTELEAGRVGAGLADSLRARGHEIREIDMTSGLQAIERRCDRAGRCTLAGGADPRREGLVIGR
jgi:gamma-glutamyltranspeptidase/glutathione hydrolase